MFDTLKALKIGKNTFKKKYYDTKIKPLRWNHRTFQTRFQQNLSLSIKLGFKNTEH